MSAGVNTIMDRNLRPDMQLIFEKLADVYNKNIGVSSRGLSIADYDEMCNDIAMAHDIAARALGYSVRLAMSDDSLCPTQAEIAQAVDTDAEFTRVLHRVIRAANDGECLRCSANGADTLHNADWLRPPAFPRYECLAFRCAACNFEITKEQVKIAWRLWQKIAANNMMVWDRFWSGHEQTTGR
jgi:hypothetical protein